MIPTIGWSTGNKSGSQLVEEGWERYGINAETDDEGNGGTVFNNFAEMQLQLAKNYEKMYGEDEPGKALMNFYNGKQYSMEFADETTTSSVGSLPVIVEPELINLVNQKCVLIPQMKVRAIDKLTYTYNPITASSTVTWAAEAGAIANAAAQTVTYQSISPKYGYIQKGYSQVARAIEKGNYAPLREMQVQDAAEMIYQQEVKAFIGDGTSNTPYGMNTWLDTDSPRVQASAAITLLNIEDAKEAALINGGNPKICFTDNYTFSDVFRLLKAYVRTPTITTLPGNPHVEGVNYIGLNIFPAHALDSLSSGSRIMVGLDMSTLEMATLLPLTLDDLNISQTADVRLHRWRMYHQYCDKSASDASSHDGSGGLYNFKIYDIT